MGGLYARESRSISRMAHLRFSPLAVTGGKGCYLTSDDGRQLLDFAASWGTASLGHAHPALIAAVNGAMSDQAGASYLSSANLPTVLLAEKLLGIVPARAAGKVWIGHSGSDANETLARAVVAATGRKRIIAFHGAYHGGTIGSMAVSGHPAQQGVAKADGLTFIPYPNSYADGDAAATKTLDILDHLFAGPVPPQEVAALFIEPIQSDGGMLVPPPGFFAEIEKRCRQHDILLISDEVKVGLGRTGKLHAFEHFGIEPDVVVFGKALGGGLPLSAVVGPTELMNHAAAFSFQTLHGNPVCAAAGLAVIETIECEALVANAREVGRFLKRELEALKARHPLIGDVRGQGLALGVELVGKIDVPAKLETALVVYRALELGLVIYYVGVHSNVLEFTPPLTLTKEQAAHGISILDQAISDVAAGHIDPAVVREFAGW
jgi:4-aminobutyrate aminotransferase